MLTVSFAGTATYLARSLLPIALEGITADCANHEPEVLSVFPVQLPTSTPDRRGLAKQPVRIEGDAHTSGLELFV